jgi:hypothetical protein
MPFARCYPRVTYTQRGAPHRDTSRHARASSKRMISTRKNAVLLIYSRKSNGCLGLSLARIAIGVDQRGGEQRDHQLVVPDE